jgi:hypothetical protein
MAEPTPELAAIVARGDRIVTIPEGVAFHGGFSEDVTVAVRAALEQRAELEGALEKYGRCLEGCPGRFLGQEAYCNCGFRKAKALVARSVTAKESPDG